MTCRMAKKPIPWPAPTVRISILQSSGSSLTCRIANRGAALDVSSPVTDVKCCRFAAGRAEKSQNRAAKVNHTTEFRVLAGEPIPWASSDFSIMVAFVDGLPIRRRSV